MGARERQDSDVKRTFLSQSSMLPLGGEPCQSIRGRREFELRKTPHGRETQIEGFTRKAEALAWVEHESAQWLKTYEGGKYA
jgi:hypothetical protein